jgi:hypothetical protein
LPAHGQVPVSGVKPDHYQADYPAHAVDEEVGPGVGDAVADEILGVVVMPD